VNFVKVQRIMKFGNSVRESGSKFERKIKSGLALDQQS
jgi:hypothetical protein